MVCGTANGSKDKNLLKYDNARDAVKAVERRETDSAYVVSSNVNYYIKESKEDLESTILYDNYLNITAAINKKLDPQYMALFNRYARSISPERKSLMLQENSHHESADATELFRKQHPYLSILGPVVLAGIILIMIGLLLYMRKKKEYEISLEKTNVSLEEYQRMLKSISDGYQIVVQIHLADRCYRVIEAKEKEFRRKNGTTDEQLMEFILNLISSEEHNESVRRFLDVDTMASRLEHVDYLFTEIQNNENNWRRLELFVSKREGQTAETVLFTIRLIDEEKQKEELLLQTQKDLAKQIETGQAWEYQAEHDSLTGLLNRKAFERITESLKNQDIQMAFVLLDVDRFKEINDTYGHETGDEVLKNISDILTNNFRAYDPVFRLGGDEFAVIVMDQGKRSPLLNEKIFQINRMLMQSTKELPGTTISAGVAFSKNGYSEDLFGKADQALYHTKNQGRNGCTVFDDIELLKQEDIEKMQYELADYLNYTMEGRTHLGKEISLLSYRMLEYSLKTQLITRFGEKEQERLFREAGFKVGMYFVHTIKNPSKSLDRFMKQITEKLEELKIGTLVLDQMDEHTGKATFSVYEDADCSGLTNLGTTVCHYDEGFIAGVLSAYTNKTYMATEIKCWAKGDKVCTFIAEPENYQNIISE